MPLLIAGLLSILVSAASPATAPATAPSATAPADTVQARQVGTDYLGLPNLATRPSAYLLRLPSWSIADHLAQILGVATGQRQLFGIQSDLSIRGGTFDQSRVLLDGVDVTDPQTGHHSLDLPLGQADLDHSSPLGLVRRSSLFGASEAPGSVDVVPRDLYVRPGGEVSLTGGNQGTWKARGSANLPFGQARTRVSLERLRSDGDRPGTDAASWTGTGRLITTGDTGESDYFFAYSRRDFGARDFYAPFPSRERTTAVHAAMRVRRHVSSHAILEPRLFFHRHTDRFTLDEGDPDAFRSDAQTQRVGVGMRGAVDLSRDLMAAAGAEVGYDDGRSDGVQRIRGVVVEVSPLGGHQRQHAAGSFELSGARGAWGWSGGLRLDARSVYRPRLAETAVASWLPREHVALHASVASLYRVPNFTELYYADPSNLGNPSLAPEHGWTWDVGVNANLGPPADAVNRTWIVRATFFQRRELDLIDWVRPVDTGAPWQAINVGAGTTRGLETELAWTRSRGTRFALRHSWIEKVTDLAAGAIGGAIIGAPGRPLESRNLLATPRHVLAAEGNVTLPAHLELTVAARMRSGLAARGKVAVSNPASPGTLDPNAGPRGGEAEGSGAVILDARLAWQSSTWRSSDRGPPAWTIALQATNLTNHAYAEVTGVLLPGRLVALSVIRTFY